MGLAGCSGDGGDGGDSGDGGGPNTETATPTTSAPWSTSELRDKAEEEGGTIRLITSGQREDWNQLNKLLSQKFDASFLDIQVTAGSGKVAQRLIQQFQADNVKFDIIHKPTRIFLEYSDRLESTQDFEIAKELPEAVSFDKWFNTGMIGPSFGIGYSPDYIKQNNIDLAPLKEKYYNGLFDDRYKGLTMGTDVDPKPVYMGWAYNYYSEKRGMSPEEWLGQLKDHFNWKFTSSPTEMARRLSAGNLPFNFYLYDFYKSRHPDWPIEYIFPENSPVYPVNSPTGILKQASNPWTAKFVMSALQEKDVQLELAGPDYIHNPWRPDLDYSGTNIGSYTQRLLGHSTKLYSLEKQKKFQQDGVDVFKSVFPEVWPE